MVKLCRNSYTTNDVKTADYDVINKSLCDTKQIKNVSGSNFVKNSENKKPGI